MTTRWVRNQSYRASIRRDIDDDEYDTRFEHLSRRWHPAVAAVLADDADVDLGDRDVSA